MIKLLSFTRRFSVSSRCLSSAWLSKHKIKNTWTAENVVSSPFDDIEIPNKTLLELIWENIEKWPTKTASICGIIGKGYTYEEIYKYSTILGVNLRKKFGIENGNAVAIMLPNVVEYPIVLLGILSAGGIATTINPVYTAHEVHRQILLSDPKVVVASPANAHVVKEALILAKRDCPIIIVRSFGEDPISDTISFNELIEDVNIDRSVLKDVKRSPEDVCLLPYSSGTTGLPKGVELTNRNIVSNIKQQDIDELRQYHTTTDSNQNSVLASLPLFHSYGLSVVMLHKLSVGIRVVTLPKFQPDVYLETLRKYKINLLYAAPPTILFLGSHPDVGKEHLDSLHSITSGAAPLAAVDIKHLLEKAHPRLVFTQGYGLTETSPLANLTPFGHDEYVSVGWPIPNVQEKIIDKDGHALGPNEVGELLIKGPNVMKGYKGNDKASQEAFTEDNFFKTGDLGRIDELGQIYILDRLKELIKVKGFQVPPAELEGVLKEHDSVLDAAVVGADDEKSGEVPVAFVIVKDGYKANEKILLEFVAERVAPFKRIKQIKFVNTIPKNPSGKILRRVLKEEYL